MTAEKLTDHATLPDDPADACRAILDVVGGAEGMLDFPHGSTPLAFADLVLALADAQDGYERAEESLRIMAWHARDAATAQHDALTRIHKIARHGTGDWREMDRRIAEGKCAFSGPTVAEVHAAQKVLAAYGDDASEEAALKVLASMSEDAKAAS